MNPHRTYPTDLSLETVHDRVVLLEGRIGSYADAELAYRSATADIRRVQDEHVSANATMIQAAKAIMEKSVTAAVEQFKEPLEDVARIRSAQRDRHLREKIAQEDQAARDTNWKMWKVRLGCSALVVGTLGEVYRVFFHHG